MVAYIMLDKMTETCVHCERPKDECKCSDERKKAWAKRLNEIVALNIKQELEGQNAT